MPRRGLCGIDVVKRCGESGSEVALGCARCCDDHLRRVQGQLRRGGDGSALAMAVYTHGNIALVVMPKGWKSCGGGRGEGGVGEGEVAGHNKRVRGLGSANFRGPYSIKLRH